MLLERRATLNEGRDILVQHDKHIKLAEKYGWEAIDCYVEEPLASDSDDDRTLEVLRLLLGNRKQQAVLCIYGTPIWFGYGSICFY